MLNSINNKIMHAAIAKAENKRRRRDDIIAVLTIIAMAVVFAALATI